jgi:glutathione S-transferase
VCSPGTFYTWRPTFDFKDEALMKLIGSTTSPYVRKVRIVLAEKRMDCEFVKEDVWSAQTTIGQKNPLGKIPVLLLDDNTPIYDSRVIVEYLDARAPTARLIPDENRDRAEVKTWEALADGSNDAAIAMRLESNREPQFQLQSWIDRQRLKVDRALAEMSRALGKNAWCHGKSFSLADVATGVALGYLSFRFPQIEWAQQYPNLLAHYEKLMDRESFKSTAPQ